MKTNFSILKATGRKAALLSLLAVSAIGSFATLGDGKLNKEKPKKSLLSTKSSLIPGTFSLKSGYTFRGNQVIGTSEEKYVNINTIVTYQQGHTTYVLPVKKKVSVNLTSQNQVQGATVKFRF